MCPTGNDDKARKGAKTPAKRPATAAARDSSRSQAGKGGSTAKRPAAATASKGANTAKRPAAAPTSKGKSSAAAKDSDRGASAGASGAKGEAAAKPAAAGGTPPTGQGLGAKPVSSQTVAAQAVKAKPDTVSIQEARRFQVEITKMNGQLAELRKQLAEAQRSVADQARRLTEKDKTIEQLSAEVERVNAKLFAKDDETSLAKFVEDTGVGILQAQQTLKKSGAGFSLGKVSLDMKMVPSAGGMGLRFPKPEEVANLGGDRMSRLTIDFNAEPAADEGKSEALPLVPRLTGYTEVMARRKLVDAGFVPEVVQQALSAERAGRVGKVVKQWPAAGTGLEAGSVVTLAIGKLEG